MAKGKFIPVFERSLKEQAAWIKPQVERAQAENLERGLYNIYRDEHCTTKDMIVREYSDRKELVKVDACTGHTVIIKRIS